MVEGEAVAMQISCTTLRECSHDKISWYIKDEEIPFDPRDLHFRRESNHNFHRLWIDKAYPSDEGTFSARKDDDEYKSFDDSESLGEDKLSISNPDASRSAKVCDDTIPLAVAFGSSKDYLSQIVSNISEHEFLYDNYNADGLSGSPVFLLTTSNNRRIVTLQGIHIGESASKKYRVAQKINFTTIKTILEAYKSIQMQVSVIKHKFFRSFNESHFKTDNYRIFDFFRAGCN